MTSSQYLSCPSKENISFDVLMKKITLFIPFGRDISLLKSCLEYYTEMGIQRILLSVHIRQEWQEGFLDAVNEAISGFPAKISEIHTGTKNDSAKRYETVIGKYCKSDDWVIVADLDEFYEYSRPLHEVLEYCLSYGYDNVIGEYLDRIGPKGNLPDLQDNLWDTFPVGLQISKSIAKACSHKIVLARANIRLSGGHHKAYSGKTCPTSEISAIVHHFKWDSTCIERIKYMKSMYQENNLPWVNEPKRVLKFLETNKGRFDISLAALEAYWPMYKRSCVSANAGLKSIWEDPTKITPKQSSSLKIQKQSDTIYLVNGAGIKPFVLNQSSMAILTLCNGYNSASDIVTIIRNTYPSGWLSMEQSVQAALRSLYAEGLITYP